ncbi:pleckstrin homology domain-containing family G member 6-like [Watersipora subatra]|uniref:pleckstrin homology domain-containing family G member 6-like n=1 Tax=Watersipora subatra TaxID=2589382 RepID=UPI00355B826D
MSPSLFRCYPHHLSSSALPDTSKASQEDTTKMHGLLHTGYSNGFYRSHSLDGSMFNRNNEDTYQHAGDWQPFVQTSESHVTRCERVGTQKESRIKRKFSITKKISRILGHGNSLTRNHKKVKKSFSEDCDMKYEEPDEFSSRSHIMRPTVISEEMMGSVQVVVEFYAQAAADRMDRDEGDPRQAYNRGRRSCVVPTLELGDNESQAAEESSEAQSYPGDLVLHNGQALRHPSPPIMNGDSADFYGSEGSLATETNLSSSPVLHKDEKKTLKSKNSIFRAVSLKCVEQVGNSAFLSRKKTSLDLEYILRKMKPTEFKNEQIASSRHAHWQSVFPHVEDTTPISDKERKRRDAVWEIYTNECTFLVDQLMVLRHCFMEPLKKCQVEDLLMEVELIKLFGNLDELCDLSFKFCRNFYTALKSSPASDFASTECLCKCLNEMTLNSRDGDIYHSYLLNYRSALTYLDLLRNTSADYAAFEKHCEQDARCNKLRLPDLMVGPMQHWTRLPLLLQRVRDYTSNQDELDSLDESRDKVVFSLKSLEKKIESMKTFERVKEIEKMLIWPTISEIDSKAFIPEQLRGLLGVQPTERLLDDKIREITFEGSLILIEKTGAVDTYVFLFTDFLLFTKVKKDVKRARGRISTIEKNEGFYQVLRQPIPVESLSIHDIGAAEAGINGMKHLFVIVQRNSFQQVIGVFTLQAHTPIGKENWLKHLRDNKEKTTEINNNKAELAKQRSVIDDQSTGSTSSLLKGVMNSQVLELPNSTSTTLPRSHKMSLSLPQGKPLSEENMPAFHIKPHLMFEKNRTLSTGSLNTDQSISMVNGGYFH